MRTLVSYLHEKTPKELKIIANYWQTSITDTMTSGDSFQLAHDMQSEFLQRRVIERLTKSEIKLLKFMLDQPDFKCELNSSFNLDNSSDFLHLRQNGLVFTEKILETTERTKVGEAKKPVSQPATLVVPRELARPFLRLLKEKANSLEHKFSTQPLANLLGRLEPEKLETQAKNWNLSGLAQAQLITELVRIASDKIVQETILADLAKDCRELFQKLQRQGGRTTLTLLLEEYVSIKRLGRALRPLLERGLVWEAFEGGQAVVFIPGEVADTKSEATHAPINLQTVVPPTNILNIPPYAFAWDSLMVLAYLERNEVELTAKGTIARRHVKKFSSQFWEPNPEDESRLEFLLELCGTLGLCAENEYETQLIVSDEFKNWLELDFYQQMRRFCQTWLEHPRETGPIYYPYYYSTNKLIGQANQAMLGWLAECEPGAWYSMKDFLKKIERENPYFILARRNMVAMFGARLDELTKAWPRIEGALIEGTFATAFDWLGIVRVERDEFNHIISFSPTEFGAELSKRAGSHKQKLPEVAKPLLVQPNFEILLFAPEVANVWMLQHFAQRKKLDQVSIYTLNRNSVLEALEKGLSISGITDWLNDHSSQALPQNLIVSMLDWGKAFRRVKIAATHLIEVDDPAVLDQLLSSKQYAHLNMRRISPTAAAADIPAKSGRSDPLRSLKTKLKADGFATS